jgi:hypothetical protein
MKNFLNLMKYYGTLFKYNKTNSNIIGFSIIELMKVNEINVRAQESIDVDISVLIILFTSF